MAYRELDAPVPKPNPSRKLYHYRWTLLAEPTIGDRVAVAAGGEEVYAIVMAIDPAPELPVSSLNEVVRLVG